MKRQWAWVSLVPFLAGGCKPRDLVCEKGSYFQVLQPKEGSGVAPFSIERLGAEVKDFDLERVPDALILKSENRLRVEWALDGHIHVDSDLIFSPAEGLARSVGAREYMYPMRRSSDAGSERVRFGFRSRACRVPGKEGIVTCPLGDDDLFLAAEMSCKPDP